MKGRQVVEHAFRRFHAHLRVRKQRAARLFLQRGKARIVLVPAPSIRTVRILSEYRNAWNAGRPDRIHIVWPRDRDVEDWHDGTPEIDLGFVRGLTGGWINETDIRGQGHRHAHEPVLHQVGEVARLITVDAKVVRVHRAEERIIRVRVVLSFSEQPFEARPGSGRRQLEAFRRHVAVGTGTSVPSEVREIPVVERHATAGDGITRVFGAVESLPVGERRRRTLSRPDD